MQKLLIILGLVIIPFYEIFLKTLPFAINIAPDTRAPKEIVALVFALSIGLLAVFHGNLKPFRNKWILIIPVYLLFNLIMSPHVDMFINNVESGDFYFWKPFAEVLIFTLMIVALSSIEVDFNEIIKVMVICGAVMAGYVILQKFGLDQFWVQREGLQFLQVRGRALGGNLGQSTIVASFIVMLIPLAFYIRRYWMCLTMIIGVILTGSAMALMALGLIISAYAVRFNKVLIVPIILILVFCGLFISKNKSYAIARMDGRSSVWMETMKDIHDGAIEGAHNFSITGVGFGRFPFIFPNKHQSNFMQTHNDPLQFMYDCGIAGEYLLLAAIFFMVYMACINISPLVFSILISFIAIFFCSIGSFPFQLGAHQFYSATLVGLLHNRGVLHDS